MIKSQFIIQTTPKILVLSTKGMETEPNDKLRSLLFKKKGFDLICVKLNKIAWVLVQFITSLLCKSQSDIRFKSSLRDSIRQLMSPEEPEAVESSANKSRKDFISK